MRTPEVDTPTPRARRRALVALGADLARRGALPFVAFLVAGVTALGAVVAALVLARRGERAPLEQVPALTASAQAWGAGVLLGFGAAAGALRRDEASGVAVLLRGHGAGGAAHVWARAGGLTLVLALVVAGGTLPAGVAAVLAASKGALAAKAAQATVAALVYAFAFALVLGPLSLATLGARSRLGGYFWLLVVLVLPELLARASGAVLPEGWREVLSIPGALSELRHALMPPGVDPGRATRALVVLVLVAGASAAVVRRAVSSVRAVGVS